ncbi:MAG: hypothetical protein Q8P12_00860 [bacterium]|nr:hypothetical protein [bacterium]
MQPEPRVQEELEEEAVEAQEEQEPERDRESAGWELVQVQFVLPLLSG